MVREIPNSHYWTDLNQIINMFKCIPDVNKEYLLTGLNNTVNNGFELTTNVENILSSKETDWFISIEHMIYYVNSKEYNKETFCKMLETNIRNKSNLSNNKMERQEIYKRIDAERDYQDMVWKSDVDVKKPVSEWILYIEYHLNKAKNFNYHEDKENALAELRKIAALAIRGMEIHGCPERKENEKIYKIDVSHLAGKDFETFMKEYMEKPQKSTFIDSCDNPDCHCDCKK